MQHQMGMWMHSERTECNFQCAICCSVIGLFQICQRLYHQYHVVIVTCKSAYQPPFPPFLTTIKLTPVTFSLCF